MAFAPARTRMIQVTTVPKFVNVDADAPHVRLFNFGPAVVFVRTGVGEVTASIDNDFPVPVRMPCILDKGVGSDRLAAVSITGGPTRLYVTPGRNT
jgi:hypothetical protein